jgi:hypothetical protein
MKDKKKEREKKQGRREETNTGRTRNMDGRRKTKKK